jgi:hypothetical protein
MENRTFWKICEDYGLVSTIVNDTWGVITDYVNRSYPLYKIAVHTDENIHPGHEVGKNLYIDFFLKSEPKYQIAEASFHFNKDHIRRRETMAGEVSTCDLLLTENKADKTLVANFITKRCRDDAIMGDFLNMTNEVLNHIYKIYFGKIYTGIEHFGGYNKDKIKYIKYHNKIVDLMKEIMNSNANGQNVETYINI